MCGIVGCVLGDSERSVFLELYEGLCMLQHRGQDSAGIITCHNNILYSQRNKGLVRDVFEDSAVHQLVGNMGVGHVRYPTAGGNDATETQPFYVNSPYGITLGHNGNLTNSETLANFLRTVAFRHINTDSDSEILLNVFAHYLLVSKKETVIEKIFDTVSFINKKCFGGFSVVVMINGVGVLAFRDHHGIRPLVIGQKKNSSIKFNSDYNINGNGIKYDTIDYIAASESVVCDTLGYELIGDVEPGEAVLFLDPQYKLDGNRNDNENRIVRRLCVEEKYLFTPCIFEYVYFARPDSIINGISVYKARIEMGNALANLLRTKKDILDSIDVIIPVPDTSRTAALQTAVALGKPYREGFIKNRYVGRTFIMPGQQERVKSVRRKLNVMKTEFLDRNVLIVDDSIVRGTTSAEIVKMARIAGAKKVYIASCAPQVRYCNVYGIDIPNQKELVAYERTDEEVASILTADAVLYLPLEDLEKSCSLFAPQITQYDSSVFDGKYITGNITQEYLDNLQKLRSDAAKENNKLTATTSMRMAVNF